MHLNPLSMLFPTTVGCSLQMSAGRFAETLTTPYKGNFGPTRAGGCFYFLLPLAIQGIFANGSEDIISNILT